MDYEDALKEAGAEVLLYEMFGSYQGDWLAKVKYKNVVGWVHGYYGSCSGCDAFEAEFDWGFDDEPDFKERLAKFGRPYLNDMLTQEEVEKKCSKNLDWDCNAQEMVDYLKENKIK